MSGKAIEIRGCRTHHLKDLSLDLPREAFTVVCGVSGSGKSSLVMDTLGAESVRRFLGTLSSEGAESLARPDVDRIDGLPPAVSAGFASRAPGPRETLATIAEVYDGLRVLFTRAAVPHCPRCGRSVRAVSPEQVLSDLLARPRARRSCCSRRAGAGPRRSSRRAGTGSSGPASPGASSASTSRARRATSGPEDAVEVVVDRLVVGPDARTRFADSVEQGFRTGGGVLRAVVDRPAAAGGKPPAPTEVSFADRPFCPDCGLTYPPLSPALFSFHGLAGACPSCLGHGHRRSSSTPSSSGPARAA